MEHSTEGRRPDIDDTNATPEVSRDVLPESHEDLHVDDEAAEQVKGGDTAQTSDSQYRGRYQLKLGGAQNLLGGG